MTKSSTSAVPRYHGTVALLALESSHLLVNLMVSLICPTHSNSIWRSPKSCGYPDTSLNDLHGKSIKQWMIGGWPHVRKPFHRDRWWLKPATAVSQRQSSEAVLLEQLHESKHDTLWLCQTSYGKWTIEIGDLPIPVVVIFHDSVRLPEGIRGRSSRMTTLFCGNSQPKSSGKVVPCKWWTWRSRWIIWI